MEPYPGRTRWRSRSMIGMTVLREADHAPVRQAI